ncbi:MAG: alpha/beta fold hydrolase [Chloroflexota bacterium]|nr:alpha/beta fold hydrolase [Chloroflexota bacterium]
MKRDIRFCTTDDGVSIAYCIEGDGPDLVCCPDAFGSFALDPLIDDQMGFWRGLWRGRRVVRYDMRGTGFSQRDVEDVSHDALVRDLEAVVRASRVHQFTFWASTLSGPRAIAYSVAHPQDVRRLVLHRTFARASDLMSREQFDAYAAQARANWPAAARVFADLPVRQELPEVGAHQAKVYAQSTTGEFVARLLTQGFETTDVTPLLSQIRVPTLVLHRSDDPMIPFRLAQALAAAIPQARLIPLPQGIMSFVAGGNIDDLFSFLNDFIDDGAEAIAGSVPQVAVEASAGRVQQSTADATMTVSPAPARSFASGRYAVLRVIGEGGQKVVYLVRDEQLDRECALSMIKSKLLDADDILRLRREAQAMARLGVHSNIVSVFDFGEEDGKPYLVCEYVPGGDLRQELRSAGGSLPLGRALALASDMARALALAHARGVIHRDLKPANVWLDDNGNAKLGDFGLAFSLDRSRLTAPGSVMGTAAYLSPEQAVGEPVTERSDLYALGCLLYEMVCGRPPFADTNATAVIAQHINAAPAAPSSHEPDVPPALDALILRLLAKSPAQRPESASAVLEELRRVGDSGAAHTHAVPSASRSAGVMTEPEIRYTTTADGVSIAYYAMGEGQPLVVTSTVAWSHLRFQRFREYHRSRSGQGLGRGLQVVRYDARGTGLSDRHSLDFSIDARLLDLEAVVERLKLTRFAIFGPVHGAPAAIAYAAANPERVSHLVLADAYARGRDVRASVRQWDSLRNMSDQRWEEYTLTMANSNLGFSDSEAARKLASLYRESMTPESVRAFYEAQEAIDVTALLPRVAVPALVMYRPGAAWRLEWSRELASKIPDARFVTVTARDDLAWTDEQTRIVEDFLGVDREASTAAPR